jgi:hypothetical protein
MPSSLKELKSDMVSEVVIAHVDQPKTVDHIEHEVVTVTVATEDGDLSLAMILPEKISEYIPVEEPVQETLQEEVKEEIKLVVSEEIKPVSRLVGRRKKV